MKLLRAARRIYFRIFGKLIAGRILMMRTKEYKKVHAETPKLEVAFRKFETCLQDIEYPNNEFNKMMSMVLSDLELFDLIVQRFRRDRAVLSYISREDDFIRNLDKDRRSYQSHPLQKTNNSAIKIDVQSLFVFGMILVNRMSLLLKLYLPDKSSNGKIDMFSKIGLLYSELNKTHTLSLVGKKFKDKFLFKLKWLYAVLRFYRNEFIEHLDKGYQQGMNYGFIHEDFALTSYKWDYDDKDNERVEQLRARLENQNIKIPGRSEGGRDLINRYYIQSLFNNIIRVPDALLNEALDLVEEVGVHSPQPEKVITEIENYVEEVFSFMVEELNQSELNKFKKRHKNEVQL